MQVGPIEEFMVADHVRLDDLLDAADSGDGVIDDTAYAQFCEGLLRHIAMEEKVLLPFARAKRDGSPLPLAEALRVDHGAIAKLLARRPTPSTLEALRELLGRHNPLEEGPQGLYALCDELAGAEAPIVAERLRAQPNVPLAKHLDLPRQEGSRR